MTQVKGRATAQLSPISSPFQHKTLTNISKRTKWTEIEEGIKALLFSPEFRAKFGVCYFDSARGIVGWKCSRNLDECPKLKFKSKAMQEIHTDGDWRQHLDEFGMKVVKKKEMKKTIFIDLSFAIFQKQQPQVQIAKRKSCGSTPPLSNAS